MATEVMTAPISIHALLAESDGSYSSVQQNTKISIHALLAESDLSFAIMPLRSRLFLSTLSLRRATMCSQDMYKQLFNFYPRSPCGERHALTVALETCNYFYPRSPCGERQSCHCCRVQGHGFLSTLSLRRATKFLAQKELVSEISIHALLAESDDCYFFIPAAYELFLSTLSLRRATLQGCR